MRSTHRLLWTTVGVAVAMGLLMSTGGFSVASMDRGVSISIAEHDDAMVSIWDPGGPTPEPPMYPGENPVTPPGESVTVIVIQNNLNERIDVSVRAASTSPVSVNGGVSDVAPGEVVPVTATVDCSDVSERAPVTVPLIVQVETVGPSFESTIDFDARIVCAGAPGNASNAGQSNNSSAGTASNNSSSPDQSNTSSATTASSNPPKATVSTIPTWVRPANAVWLPEPTGSHTEGDDRSAMPTSTA